MEIYVQSCGISQEHDYRWLKIPEKTQPYPEIPHILREASRIENDTEVRLTDLYDSQEPTVVLVREREELLVLVTALEASDRTKIYGRQVRNSVAWVTQKFDKKNPEILSNIAAYVTENWDYLRKTIDEAVDFDERDGFRVNREPIAEYFEYVEYVMDVAKKEDVLQQGDNTQERSTSPKISVVYWDRAKIKKPVNYTLVFSLLLLLIPISTIVLIAKMLSGTDFQEPPLSPVRVVSPPQKK